AQPRRAGGQRRSPQVPRRRDRADRSEDLHGARSDARGGGLQPRHADARIHLHGYALGRISSGARPRVARRRRATGSDRGLTPMRKPIFALATMLLAPLAAAHHSFAIYDMQTEIEFVGVVDDVKFRNPHMSMTLRETKDGQERIIDFVEGA